MLFAEQFGIPLSSEPVLIQYSAINFERLIETKSFYLLLFSIGVFLLWVIFPTVAAVKMVGYQLKAGHFPWFNHLEVLKDYKQRSKKL